MPRSSKMYEKKLYPDNNALWTKMPPGPQCDLGCPLNLNIYRQRNSFEHYCKIYPIEAKNLSKFSCKYLQLGGPNGLITFLTE